MDRAQDSFVSNGSSIDSSNTKSRKITDIARSNAVTTNESESGDREIPRFLQDDLEDVLGVSHIDGPSSLHSKAVQTRIGGIRATSNIVYPNDFCHPVMIPNSSVTPREHPSFCISQSSELTLTRLQLYNVYTNYEKLKLRFHKLHDDYYKLIRITGELTFALDDSARGKPVDLQNTLHTCMNTYPDLFNHNIRDDYAEKKSIKSEIELHHHDLTESKQPILGIVPVSSKRINFKKVKLHLFGANVKAKLLLLQALRWVGAKLFLLSKLLFKHLCNQ